MFKIRNKTTEISSAHQRPIIELAVTYNPLPLEHAERWVTLYKDFETNFDQILNFEIRDDDVFMAGFIKCGNHWMQETLWQLLHDLDLNYERYGENHTDNNLDFIGWFPNRTDLTRTFYSQYNHLSSRRLLHSHLPASLLPKQLWEKRTKIVYVARNVKDVVVSAYHFFQWLGMWSGTMDEFVQDFMNNDIIYTSFWSHVIEFWQLRHEPNIFFITYEEMQRDLAGVIEKLCVFLEKPKLNDREMKDLLEHLSFKQMKSNKETNPDSICEKLKIPVNDQLEFMRRGIVGSFKDELTEEHRRQLDEWSHAYLAKYGVKEEDIFGHNSDDKN